MLFGGCMPAGKGYITRDEISEALEQLGEILNTLPFKACDSRSLFELAVDMANDVLVEHGQQPLVFMIEEAPRENLTGAHRIH